MDPKLQARSRRPRKRGDGPTTPDAIEIAMEAEATGRPVDESAAQVLRRHAQLLGWQIANERTSMGLRLLTGLVGLAVAGLAIVMIVSAARSRAVVVEPFGSPPELVARGFSGQVLASSLQDELQRIQVATRTTAAKRNIANAWSGAIDVEAPYTGVSIGEIEKLLRRKLGHDTRISGDLTQAKDGRLTLTVRGDGMAPTAFSGTADQLPGLVKQAAEHAYAEAEPTSFAHYLYQHYRRAESLAVVRRNLARGIDDTSRASLYNTWGNLLWAERRYAEAIAKYNVAIGLMPRRWATWANLVYITAECCGDEAGLALMRQMRAAMASAPPAERPMQNFGYAEYSLVGAYSTSIAALREEQRTFVGGVQLVTAGPRLAVMEMQRHDWRAAHEALATGDPADPLTALFTEWVDAVMALETGRRAYAIAALESLSKRQTVESLSEGVDVSCDLALVYALEGRGEAALRTLARARDNTACRAKTGHIHEALGDRAAADVAARRSIGAAPSSPFPYEARGRVLLGRGDLDGAAWRFDQANTRGPQWADPIKGQGDVLAARGRWREAAAKYREAKAFAPGWIELDEALARAARSSR